MTDKAIITYIRVSMTTGSLVGGVRVYFGDVRGNLDRTGARQRRALADLA